MKENIDHKNNVISTITNYKTVKRKRIEECNLIEKGKI